MENRTIDEEFISAIHKLYNDEIPFNKVLGLKVESISYERVKMSFQMRGELMGHYKRRMLHGGVISSAIEATGSLSAFMGLQQRIPDGTVEGRLEKFGRLGTIDMRVDFLRPGTGMWFIVTANLLRAGIKVAVTRIELHNDQDDLIAVGTATYVLA
jgi:acyl-coenzyme A thioesterase PaaI-like protein